MKLKSLFLTSLIIASSTCLMGSEHDPENAGLFGQLPQELLSRIANIAKEDCDEGCDCGCCNVLEWKDICHAQATCNYMRKYFFMHPKRIIEANFESTRQDNEPAQAFLNRVLVTLLKGNLYPHKNPASLNLEANSLGADQPALTEFIHNLDTFGIASRITELQLGTNDLLKLPENINVFKNIEKLSFSGNSVMIIEPISFDAIGSVAALKKLQNLDLSSNNINKLPDYLSTMSELSVLDISGNPLSVEELEKVCQNQSLRTLFFAGSAIATLPASMTSGGPNGTGKLTVLALDVRQLPMAELEKICNMSQLESLELNDYQLSELPKKMDKLTKLHSLNITCDTHEFEDDPNFVQPSLSCEELKKLCSLKNLESLVIDRITLTALPQEIIKLQKLYNLSLSGTGLSTQELAKVCHLEKLAYLDLTGNELQTLPNEIRNLTDLIELNLTFNNLTPAEIAKVGDLNLTKLEKLSLKGNHLQTLPQELAALHNLKELDISDNEIDTENDENYASLISQLPQDLKIVNEHEQQQEEPIQPQELPMPPAAPVPPVAFNLHALFNILLTFFA